LYKDLPKEIPGFFETPEKSQEADKKPRICQEKRVSFFSGIASDVCRG
jgi:hypothetical protein